MNKYKPHVLVLPEDDANRQLANGFLLNESLLISRIRVLVPAGGWTKVLDAFTSVHVDEMDRYQDRFMVLLIDYDGKNRRLKDARAKIPSRLSNRVFVLGAFTKPEDLTTLGSYEGIGLNLANDCRDGTDSFWGHNLLQHNASELERLREHVRPILFGTG